MSRVDTVVEQITHLDFTPTLPCEHSQHGQRHPDEPAAYLVDATCPECGDSARYLLCRSGFARMVGGSVGCNDCATWFPSEQVVKILAVLP